MASYRDINALAKDPIRVRATAQFLLTLPDTDWSDWELDFLEDMAMHTTELTTRQAEKLVEVRDDAVRYTSASGYKFATVIEECWRNRLDLDDEDDIDFIERLKVALGEIEPFQGWFMPRPAL